MVLATSAGLRRPGGRTYAGTMTGPNDALFTHIDHVGIAAWLVQPLYVAVELLVAAAAT